MKDPAFAFLVHPRNLNDVYIKFPFLRFLPRSFVYFLLTKMPPVLVSRIKGLRDREGKPVGGYVISIPLTAKQMIENRTLAVKKMIEAVRFAKKRGVAIIGLGALTASLSRGGIDLANKEKEMGFTTGRAYTVKTVTDYVKNVIGEFNFNKTKVKIAIVGAAGSIGSGCAALLSEWGIDNFLLIDLERKLPDVENKIKEIHSRVSHDRLTIKKSHHIGDVNMADIIITATNAPEVVLRGTDVQSGAIIINDAQPSDIAPDVYDRDDVLVIEGGVISTPGIRTHFNFGLAHHEEAFCCLGEVLVLAHNGLFSTFTIGNLEKKYIEDIEKISEQLHFSITKYQNEFGYIDPERIFHVKKIISRRGT